MLLRKINFMLLRFFGPVVRLGGGGRPAKVILGKVEFAARSAERKLLVDISCAII